MVQIRGPRGRRVKENMADEAQDGGNQPKKKRGVKPLFRRTRCSSKDVREPTGQLADSDQYPEEAQEEERDSPPTTQQSPSLSSAILPRTPSLWSDSSLASKGTSSPLARHKSSTSVGTNDKSVEVVLQEDEPTKNKKSPWFSRAKHVAEAHENHRLPPTESTASALSQLTMEEQVVEVVDASAAAKEEERDIRDELYQVNLTPSMLMGFVASSKQTSAASSAQCYVRIVSEVSLVDDCPGIVRSLPFQLDMGAEDKRRGGKNIVVLWPNDTLTTSIGTISYRTTEADIQAFGGFDLEIGVESNGELLPLGSTTLYLDGDEVHEENVTLKINSTPTKSPKRIKRLFRVGNEKKPPAGASLDDNALINVGLEVIRIQHLNSSPRSSPHLNSSSRSSPWLQPGSPALLNMILQSFSNDQAAKPKVEECKSEERLNIGEVVEPVSPGQFSCCSGFVVNGDEYTGEDDDALLTGQNNRQVLEKTEDYNQEKSTKSAHAESEKLEKTIHRTLNKARKKTETAISTDAKRADVDDETYGLTSHGTMTDMGQSAMITYTGASDIDGWTMSSTGAPSLYCSVFSCCFGQSIPDESLNNSPLKNKSLLSLDEPKSIDIADSMPSEGSVDGYTDADSLDLTGVSNGGTMDLTASMIGSNQTTTNGLEDTTFCSPCCSPRGPDDDIDRREDEGDEKFRPANVTGIQSSQSSMTQQHMFEQEGNTSMSGDLKARKVSNQDVASLSSSQLRATNDSTQCEGRNVESGEMEKIIVGGEVESNIRASMSDAGANYCWQCCGEEDVANIGPLPEADNTVPTETQIADEQTPLLANLCMTCLGDEDITKLRVMRPNVPLNAGSENVGIATVDTPKSNRALTSNEESLIIKVVGPHTTEAAEAAEAAGTRPSRDYLDVDFSSSYDTEGASFEQGISVDSSTGTSLYSYENATRKRWFPFFGGLEGTQTGSDDAEHSVISSRHSSETGSSFSQSTSQSEK